MTGRGAIQVQYAVPRCFGPVSKADLVSALDGWLERRRGLIRVMVTVWGERLTEDQKRDRVRQLGADRRHRPGRVDRYAEANVTMCDYDGPELPELWRVWKLARQLGAAPVMVEDRKTAHGWHRVIVWNREFSRMETIAIQLLLGSDREREAFNLRRAMTGTRSDRWNLLFTHKL